MGLTGEILTGVGVAALWLVGLWLYNWYYHKRHNRNK